MFSPLAGVQVVSFTHFLQGPSASQLLADLGADVIKVEPLDGAFERSWSAPDAFVGGRSAFFLLGNRNVRSMAMNLKSPRAAEAIRRLISGADVLIESFRPGTMDRLGFGHKELRESNPRLIYCSLSGYGSSGPYSERPGQDVLIQAMSGLAMATGREGDPPTPAGASLVDQHGAVLAAFGILAALAQRDRTGVGLKVESNLLSAALDLQIEPLTYALNGFRPRRSRSGISSGYYKAPYGIYETADGSLCLSLSSLALLGRIFDDPWFAEIPESTSYDRREEIDARIRAHMARRDTASWVSDLEKHSAWYAPVNSYEEVINDAQVAHNESIMRCADPEGGEVRLLGHPVTYDGTRPGVTTFPPALGSSTRELLRGLGYSDSAVDSMIEAGEVRVDAD